MKRERERTSTLAVYHMRGAVYHRYLDKTDQALEDYSVAIELDSQGCRVLFELGVPPV